MPLLHKNNHMWNQKQKDEKKKTGGGEGREGTLMGGEYHMIDATNQR